VKGSLLTALIRAWKAEILVDADFFAASLSFEYKILVETMV
jgi:hypothetical protein